MVILNAVAGKAGDDTTPWDLSGFTVAPAKASKPVAKEKLPLLVKCSKGADVERLQKLLNANGGWEAIFPLLGNMEEMPPTEDGVPSGWQGTSGMRIYRPEAINNRVRRWALPEAA